MNTYHAFLQSLEDEIVSETVLKLVSLKLWFSLSYGRFQVTLFLPLPSSRSICIITP